MKKFLTILIAMVAMAACKVCEPIMIEKEVGKTVEVIHRDTTILTKADSAQVRLLLRCDSANNVLLDEISTSEGERLRLQARLRQLINGQSELSVDCREDSLLNIIHMQDSIIKTNTSQTIVKETKVIPPFYKNCTIAMWIIVVLIALFIAARIIIKIYLHK